MAQQSTTDLEVIHAHPIGTHLDRFLAAFRLQHLDGKEIDVVAVIDRLTSDEVKEVVGPFIKALTGHSAARTLCSRFGTGPLTNDLVDLFTLVKFDALNVKHVKSLLEVVFNVETSDIDIWSAVFQLIEHIKSAPTTPPPRGTTIPQTPSNYSSRFNNSSVPDIPFSINAGTVYSTDEGRDNMDEVIKNEMIDHIYLNLPDFFTTFFDSVDGLRSLAKAVFTKCQEIGLYTQAGCWRSFPESYKENDITAWFREEVERLVELASKETHNSAHTITLKSRHIISLPSRPLLGSTAPRKLDIGFATCKERDNIETTYSKNQDTPQYQWRDILVPGELKSGKAKDSQLSTWCDLGRYVREVYAAQDNRLFSHGFTICGDVMRVWRFDRGAVYAAPPFSVNQDGQRFVTVVLGYLLMREEELGYDATISKGDQRYISVVRNGTKERFLIEKMIYRELSIIGRGTTCWKATCEGNDEKFVIKDSWQYEGKVDEGELLMKSTQTGIQNVAPCYHSETVRIGETDDDLHGNIRKQIDISSGRKWKLRQENSTLVSSKNARLSSLHKRAASTTLENGSQKKPRLDTTRNRSASNRLHKRIIMSRYGKPLHLAKTRLGLLKGLIDGISGHQHLFLKKKILHRDISIGNVLISEDETEGFLIDLDHAIPVDRAENSGARGTKVFMSIGLLLHGYRRNRPHSFMDDLESMFWLLFWICVHYSGPGGKWVQKSTKYENWNFRSPQDLGDGKTGLIANEDDFLDRIDDDFSDYFAPLSPWVNRLRRIVFPGGVRWSEEDPTLYDRMKDVLQQAMEDPAMVTEWPDDTEARQTHPYQTRSKGQPGKNN